jgi:hypothetical protein
VRTTADRGRLREQLARRWLSVAEITLRDQRKGGVEAAVALDALPAGALTALRVAGRALTKPERMALERTAKRFGVPLEISGRCS